MMMWATKQEERTADGACVSGCVQELLIFHPCGLSFIFPLLKKCRLLVCVQFVPEDFLLFYYLVVGKRPEIDAETMT
jgi:hypothetical protein